MLAQEGAGSYFCPCCLRRGKVVAAHVGSGEGQVVISAHVGSGEGQVVISAMLAQKGQVVFSAHVGSGGGR
jgi:hypothetical protein